MYRMTITAGTSYTRNNLPLFQRAERIDMINRYLAKAYGGYTMTDSTGGWVDADGNLITEAGQVWVVMMPTNDAYPAGTQEVVALERAKSAAQFIGHTLDQTAVVWSVERVHGGILNVQHRIHAMTDDELLATLGATEDAP